MRQYHYTWGSEDLLMAELTVDKEGDVYTIVLNQEAISDSCFARLEQANGTLIQRNTEQKRNSTSITLITTLILTAVCNPRPETLFNLIE